MTGGMYDAVFYSCFNVISMLMLMYDSYILYRE